MNILTGNWPRSSGTWVMLLFLYVLIILILNANTIYLLNHLLSLTHELLDFELNM